MTVATKPLFDDSISTVEFQARAQMGLDDGWRIKSLARPAAPSPDFNHHETHAKWDDIPLEALLATPVSRGRLRIEMFCESDPYGETKAGVISI